MRLIDADKIEFVLPRTLTEEEKNTFNLVIKKAFENAPTVEAIPTNWIKNWCVKNYPTYPRIITEQLLKKTETWRMIEDWEKENDKDSE